MDENKDTNTMEQTLVVSVPKLPASSYISLESEPKLNEKIKPSKKVSRKRKFEMPTTSRSGRVIKKRKISSDFEEVLESDGAPENYQDDGSDYETMASNGPGSSENENDLSEFPLQVVLTTDCNEIQKRSKDKKIRLKTSKAKYRKQKYKKKKRQKQKRQRRYYSSSSSSSSDDSEDDSDERNRRRSKYKRRKKRKRRHYSSTSSSSSSDDYHSISSDEDHKDFEKKARKKRSKHHKKRKRRHYRYYSSTSSSDSSDSELSDKEKDLDKEDRNKKLKLWKMLKRKRRAHSSSSSSDSSNYSSSDDEYERDKKHRKRSRYKKRKRRKHHYYSSSSSSDSSDSYSSDSEYDRRLRRRRRKRKMKHRKHRRRSFSESDSDSSAGRYRRKRRGHSESKHRKLHSLCSNHEEEASSETKKLNSAPEKLTLSDSSYQRPNSNEDISDNSVTVSSKPSNSMNNTINDSKKQKGTPKSSAAKKAPISRKKTSVSSGRKQAKKKAEPVKFTPPDGCNSPKASNGTTANQEPTTEALELPPLMFAIKKEKCEEEAREPVEEEHNEEGSLESRLFQLDKDLKQSIGSTSEDYSECLRLLEQLAQMPLTPELVRKEPQLILTIRRLRVCRKSEEVRNKASELYETIRVIFFGEVKKEPE